METDPQLQSLIELITNNLFKEADYYILYCRYYFFDDQASEYAPVLFHREHIFGVQLLATDMLLERMPVCLNTKGKFTVRIPYDQIYKITTVDPECSPAKETVLFIRT